MPDSSFVLPLLAQSALLPFGIALALLAGLRALRVEAATVVLAVAAGFVASFFAVLHAQWSYAPKVALDWTPWIVVAGALGALAAESLHNAAGRVAVRLAVSLVAAALVVLPALESFGLPKAALAAGTTGVLIAVAWSWMAHAAERRPTPPWLLALVAGGTGLALMLDSSQSIGQLSGALASVLAACVVFNLPRVRMAFPPSAAGLSVLLLGVLLANAHLYAGFSAGYVALLVAGLAADAVIAGINGLRRARAGMGSWISAAVLAAVPVIVTIGLAVKAAHESGGY